MSSIKCIYNSHVRNKNTSKKSHREKNILLETISITFQCDLKVSPKARAHLHFHALLVIRVIGELTPSALWVVPLLSVFSCEKKDLVVPYH